MAFPQPGGGPPFHHAQPFADGQFDIFEWHNQFESCVRYFLDHAQHTGPVQAVAAFINIQLPFQKAHNPAISSRPTASPAMPPGPGGAAGVGPSSARAAGKLSLGLSQSSGMPGDADPRHVAQAASYCTLNPYIRRLVATGFDIPAVLHGFFGDDWAIGVGPLHEAERRNYLFAAKSDSWLRVKTSYDMDEGQMVPFLKPLQNVTELEIQGAEASWSEWLAMQDWMLGPRAPVDDGGAQQGGHGGVDIKREEE
ncbi:hypothetical protein RB595_002796 [Gaeumannomyces hyphopodioides]